MGDKHRKRNRADDFNCSSRVDNYSCSTYLTAYGSFLSWSSSEGEQLERTQLTASDIGTGEWGENYINYSLFVDII